MTMKSTVPAAVSFFLFLAFIPATVSAVDPASVRLNNKGMDYYDQKDYSAACERFIEALEIDGSNYMAHYNLACTMCLLRKTWSPCGFYPESEVEFDIYMDTILYHLDRAAQLNEKRRTRMLEDPDLEIARTTLRFHQIAERSLTNDEDAKLIIPQVNWRLNKDTEVPGSWNLPSGTIGFTEDGRFTIELYEEEKFGKGRYKIEDGKIVFLFESGDFDVERFTGEITKNNIIIDELCENDLIIWSSTEECTA